MNALRRLRRVRNQRGVELIEFAIVLPLLLILTLTVVDFSRAFFMKSILTAAAREGARLAVVTNDPAAAQTRAVDVAKSGGVTDATSSVTGPDANKFMECTVSGNFSFLYPGLFSWLGNSFSNPMLLTASVSMRKEG